MENFKVVKLKEYHKRYVFMAGQVIHPKDNPENYTIKVGNKDIDLYIVIGRKGIYLLKPELVKKMAEKLWLNYLKEYKNSKRRGSKAKEDMVRHPNVIDEDTIREVLKEEGYSPCNCLFIDFQPDIPKDEESAKKILEEIENIIKRAKVGVS